MPVSSKLGSFIGCPWVSGGRDAVRGCGCLGPLLARSRGVVRPELPDFGGYEAAHDLAGTGALFGRRLAGTRRAEGAERPGDVVVLKLKGTPAHAGLIVDTGLM